MKTSHIRRRLLMAAATAALAATSLTAPFGAQAATNLAFRTVDVGPYGGEPSITSDAHGVLYDTSPSGPETFRSTTGGASWTPIQSADNNSGDDCLATDQSTALYWCNLASTTQGVAPLQADNWKSTIASTCTSNCNWVHGAGAIPQCSTSCSPFGVDRQWTAASIPAGGTTANAEVVLMYHDFYGPSQIWVNISRDGGKTFGAPQEVLASPAVTPGAIAGTLEAQSYTLCNTVPAGVGIVPPGKPHAGRIYVSWIAADLPQNATGCNITMTQSFHTVWVSYSDDNGSTWTPQQAFDAGFGHDTSTPFTAFTLDDQGNPYLAFASPGPKDNPTVCAAESAAGTVQSDPTCDYHTWVVWCQCRGSAVVFGDGRGLIPGSASAAYEVDPSNTAGTDVFPTLAAGDPGQVDVGWLGTNEIVPTDTLGKFNPGGCAGPSATGNPPTYPPTCHWNLFAGQSLNLTRSTATATWTRLQVTPTPMHVGDVCNLGIFCVDPSSNRNLLDFNQETIDQTTGCAHIAYADDVVNRLRAANQTHGCLRLRL
jgi:hypothetical protein